MMWDRKYVHFLGMALEALPAEKRRLGLLCCLAAALHFFMFFLFRFEYPSSIPIRPTRTHITLFSPDASGNQSLQLEALRYELNDPSRFIRIQPNWLGNAPLPVQLLEFKDSGSAPLISSEDLTTEFLPNQLVPLSERASESLQPPVQPFHYTVTLAPPIADQTVALWEEPLKSRWVGNPWQLPTVSSDLIDKPCVTVLRVAVNSLGEVVHVLVETPSLKSDADLMGVDRARHLRFMPAPASLQWARVTIFWKMVAPQSQVSPGNGG